MSSTSPACRPGRARIAAVLERDTRRPIVLLSGDIDSILIAAKGNK